MITVAITAVLMLIFLSSRMIRFLDQAVEGTLTPELIGVMILYRVPSAIELILPLALTLGVLLTLSRLHLDSELVVIRTSGVTTQRLFAYTSVLGVFSAIFLLFASNLLFPKMLSALDQHIKKIDRLTAFDTATPGRFEVDDNNRLLYAESRAGNNSQLTGVFMSEPPNDSSLETFIRSDSAVTERRNDEDFLVLIDGYRYVGKLNSNDWEITRFDRYLLRMGTSEQETTAGYDTLSTLELILDGSNEALAVVNWRVSMPVLIFTMMPFAFVVGQSAPRRNRVLWIIPIILLEFFYFIALSNGQKAIERGEWSPVPGLLWVHLSVFICGLCMYGFSRLASGWGRA